MMDLSAVAKLQVSDTVIHHELYKFWQLPGSSINPLPLPFLPLSLLLSC